MRHSLLLAPSPLDDQLEKEHLPEGRRRGRKRRSVMALRHQSHGTRFPPYDDFNHIIFELGLYN